MNQDDGRQRLAVPAAMQGEGGETPYKPEKKKEKEVNQPDVKGPEAKPDGAELLHSDWPRPPPCSVFRRRYPTVARGWKPSDMGYFQRVSRVSLKCNHRTSKVTTFTQRFTH
jgi:hypothetical protein